MDIKNDLSLAKSSLELVKKDLRLSDDFTLTEADPLHALLHYLTRVVQDLLNNDFAMLVNAMYRIDIPEEKFSETLEQSRPEKIAENLAFLILEREKTKVLLRNKYST